MDEGIDYRSVFEYKKDYPPKTEQVKDASDQRREANDKQVVRRDTTVNVYMRRCR